MSKSIMAICSDSEVDLVLTGTNDKMNALAHELSCQNSAWFIPLKEDANYDQLMIINRRLND